MLIHQDRNKLMPKRRTAVARVVSGMHGVFNGVV